MNEIREGIITVFILSLITVGFFYSVIAHDNAELSTTTVIPEPYYTGTRNPDLTYEDLERVVFDASMPHEYKRDVFDCTEGSAWMEHYLENKGFDTIIRLKNRHAYVIVRLNPKDECVNSFLVHGRAQFLGYCQYDDDNSNHNEYEDIYEACEQGWYSEWDWWNEVSVQ